MLFQDWFSLIGSRVRARSQLILFGWSSRQLTEAKPTAQVWRMPFMFLVKKKREFTCLYIYIRLFTRLLVRVRLFTFLYDNIWSFTCLYYNIREFTCLLYRIRKHPVNSRHSSTNGRTEANPSSSSWAKTAQGSLLAYLLRKSRTSSGATFQSEGRFHLFKKEGDNETSKIRKRKLTLPSHNSNG